MKTILSLMLLFLVNVSAAPTRKVECRDQYGHCPEWSKAGFCDKTGYKTYMTLMCAYSCDTCKALHQKKESEEETVASASGIEDAGQLDNPSDIQEATEKEDGASANEPLSGEGEIHGDSNSYGDKEEGHHVDKLQNEHSIDAALESQNQVVKQSTKREQRQSISEENKDKKDVPSKQMRDKNVAAAEDRDPPGVHLLKFQDNNVDDAVNPRSKISTRPIENPSVNYKPLSETKVQNKDVSKKQDEDVSASGSTLDESGGGEEDENKPANPKASDKSTETKSTSGESEEMKDIAGDIKTGSKIFETDISEPESISGCSSGFGCFSGNGEEIQAEKSEEAVELEPRSKIATVPQVVEAKSKQADKNIKTVQMQTSTTVRETASGSNSAVQDDIQSNGEDEAPEKDDIAGPKSAANSNSKVTTTASETQEENLKATKSDKEDEKMSNEKASSGSEAEVNDDIQGQSVHGDNDESIDGGKSVGNSDALSGSGTDTPQLKSESPKEVQDAAKSDAVSKKVNEQKEGMQTTTVKSEQVDKDNSLAKSNAKNADMYGQNDNMNNAAAKSTSSDQNQSAAKTDADNEEMNTDKDDAKDNDEKSKSLIQNVSKSDTMKGNEQEDKEEKQQQEDNTTKSEPTNEDGAAKDNADSKEVDGQKDAKDKAEPKPDKNQNSDVENEDDTENTPESEPNDKQSAAKGDEENEELNGQKDVKEVRPNDSQSGKGNEEAEGSNDASSGSVPSIDDDVDKEPSIDGTKSKTKTADAEERDMEDALNIDDLLKENKLLGAGSGQSEQDNNEDLSTPAARQKIKSMEQLIKDENAKPKKAKDDTARTRENVPSAEETPDDFINTDLGKGQRVKLLLDQHYYKPYSNEDSMAYEMLALDLKKEVERAVGNQAIVSQISFSEIRKPGSLPRYSQVLATFMLHGDMHALHAAVRKGLVGDLMVDKEFFQSS